MTKLYSCPECQRFDNVSTTLNVNAQRNGSASLTNQGNNRTCPTCSGFGQVDEKGLRRFELAQKVKRKGTNPNPYIDNF